MIPVVISLMLGLFSSLVGFKIYRPKLKENTNTAKWEKTLSFFRMFGIISLSWALFQLLIRI